MTETFIDARRTTARNMAGRTFVAFMLACLTLLTGCATQGKNTVVVQSENQDTRVRVIVIHHTSEDFQGSLDILTKDSSRPVSSHYLVPEPGDPSYTDKKLKVYQLVPEQDRAWHAGTSYWAGRTALNDMSVGIEIVNQTYCRNAEQTAPAGETDQPAARICFFPDFPESQLAMVIDLLKGITERHPEVKPTDIVGHSDIAPQRKIDPGPRFPWQRLYKLGFGAWYDDDTVFRYWEQFRQSMPPVLTLQTALHEYGYAIELSGVNDEQSQNVLRAFQMHFRPWLVNSEYDAETVAVLYALLEKYRPEKLGALLPAAAPAAQTEQSPVP
jgi:N-acetyl-anhydromuramyl-L-alanine amidase AmpD